MDSDDVVQRIAAEVLKRLQVQDGQGAPAETPAARPSAGTAPAACRIGEISLVLLTGGDRRLDVVLAQLERIARRSGKTRVVLSPSAQRVIGLPEVRRAAPDAEVLTEGEIERLLEGVDHVFLPNMSLNAAAKIAGLVPDSLVCILAIQALLRGVSLSATGDCLLPAGIDARALPPAVERRLSMLLAGLAELGVRVCALDQMVGPGQLVDPATGESKPNPDCSLAAGGDCEGCGLCVSNQPAAVKALLDSGADRVGAGPGVRPGDNGLAGLIDHTLLKPDATEAEIRKLCHEARQFEFASVCINPAWVPLAAQLLAGSPVKVCTVIGFPLGATTPTAKAVETRDAIANGATEIDMVINVGALKSGDDELVRRDIEAVVQAAGAQALVKVILETALLTRDEKVKACLLAKMAGADFVKTSTGFSSGGATVADIALMRETVGPDMGVKASGGIRDRSTADAMVAAGASRIGASASVAIVEGKKDGGKGY